MPAITLEIHSQNPQKRLIRKAAEVLDAGGVIAYPTDSSYALGCHLGDKSALDRIKRIRRVDDKHNYTLVGRDISQITDYVKVDNQQFRVLKTYTPGPYTFIFPAKRKVPRRSLHQKRHTIGIRVPDNVIVQEMLGVLHEPILSSTLSLPGHDLPLGDPDDVIEKLTKHVDLIIDGGHCGIEPTTVIDWHGDSPEIVRQGKGVVSFE
ncbi:MAG: L-threonylcarbamoyladenylate synthase [Arenicella sp.]